MITDLSERDEVQAQSPDGPGAFLRERRQALGLSEREVADRLCLVLDQVRALEQDNFHYFNAEIYYKGYLRSYARLLDLSLDDVLAHYSASGTRWAHTAPAQIMPMRVRPSLQLHTSKWHWGLIAVVFVVFGLWFWQQERQGPAVAMPASVSLIDRVDVSAVEQLIEQDASIESQQTPTMPVEEQTDEAVPEQPQGQSQETEPQSISDVIGLRFSAECWVELRDASGELLLADLKRAGDTVELRGQAPFRLLLGYAPAATVSLNGEPVAITGMDANNAVSMMVGKS